MGHISYEYIKFPWKDLAAEAAETTSAMFSLCVDALGMSGERAAQLFVGSGMARQIELLNAPMIMGKNELDQLEWMLWRCGIEADLDNLDYVLAGTACWVGEVLFTFHAETGMPFKRILSRVSYDDIEALQLRCVEWDPQATVRELLIPMYVDRADPNPLRTMRLRHGLTQNELAGAAGISLRTLQQYEQGTKDVSRAAAVTVLKLAHVLGCEVEDLVDPKQLF